MEDEKCLLDLSSERDLYLESGDLFLDLPKDLNCLVDELGFAADLLCLASFPDKSSRVWFKSVSWRLEP